MPWLRSRTDRQPPAWLTARPFAHRGLHGDGRIENSRASFEAAIGDGFGIELDVRAARDGAAFVFHDATLERLCEAEGRFEALDAVEASSLHLAGSNETIPALGEILAQIDGRAPLLVEIKSDRGVNPALCANIRAALDGYRGSAAVMAFDPRIIRWFMRNAPAIPRGLVISEEGRRNIKALTTRRLAIFVCRPDFLAYDIRSLPSSVAARERRRGLPILSWTVRDEGQRAMAMLHADQIIHELPLRVAGA